MKIVICDHQLKYHADDIVTKVLYFWCDKFENNEFESDEFTLL